MAAPVCGLTIVKKFTYRGDPEEEWSNHYLLTGSTPASGAAWLTLANELANLENGLYNGNVSIIRYYGYNSADPTVASVWSHTLDTPIVGGLTAGVDAIPVPGDVAATLRWHVDRLSTKGKPIYLRKYFHGVYATSAAYNAPEPGWTTTAESFISALQDGFGADDRKITDRLGTDVVGGSPGEWLTTRTLKRRGKRP